MRRITPAEVDFSDPGAPVSPAFGDVYHSRAGALAQARHVFLGGNGLPGRWQGRERFVVLETGFGLGNNFLATWHAWRQDPARCERLVFVSVEKHPLRREDLSRAHAASALQDLAAQLLDCWPPLTPGLHRLGFEGGRVELLLGLGDARELLRELVLQADAFYLDGFAPARNPQLWDAYLFKALARLAAPGATAATWSVARPVRDGLASSGFAVSKAPGFGGKGEMTRAVFAPHHRAPQPPGRQALARDARDAREAIVLGAGLAGAACALALADQGLAVTVVDALPQAAGASSGNPAGLFHGTLNPDDGPHARFNRAAALATQALLKRLGLPCVQQGLLRLELARDLAQMQQDARGLPATYVQALAAPEASALAGIPLAQAAWHYPGGGALAPRAYVAAMLGASGAALRLNTPVAALRQCGTAWQLLCADGRVLAETGLLVLAGGHAQRALLAAIDPALAAELITQRGQISRVAPAPARLGTALAGDGYAIDAGPEGFWCGATTQDADPDPQLRAADHVDNLARLTRLLGQAVPATAVEGRVGWRLLTADRLPLIGGLADPAHRPAQRAEQVRFHARLPGLVLCTALGSRGISWAALAGQVAAARALGTPCPIEADLLDAVDPVRYVARAERTLAQYPHETRANS